MSSLVLGESLEVLIDHRGKTPKKLDSQFVSVGVPVASAMLVQNGRLMLEQARRVDLDLYRRWMSVPTRRYDVLLTSEAPLGRVALVPDDEPLVLGQRLFGLRGKPGVLDSRFLFYALQSEEVQSELQGRATGTTVSGIRQSELVRVHIPAPSYPQQIAIAAVLGALDDKIAVNERIEKVSEQVAVAVIGLGGHRQTCPLASIVTWVKEQVLPENIHSVEVEHFSIPAFDSDRLPELTTPVSIKSAKFRVPSDAVLVSKLNPVTPRVWRVKRSSTLPGLASTEFMVLVPIAELSTADLWAVCSQSDFSERLAGMVTGTSNSHQRVKPVDLLASDVVDPCSLSDGIRNQIRFLLDCANEARWESRALGELRNLLLPKLMSGEISVRHAEKVVEEVL